MDTALLVVVGVAALAGVALLAPSRPLEGRLEPGERVLHQESGVLAKAHVVAGAPTDYPNCRVLVTDRRILVGQKYLLQKGHILRFDFRREPTPGALDGSAQVATADSVEVKEGVLSIRSTGLTMAESVDLHLRDSEAARTAFAGP